MFRRKSYIGTLCTSLSVFKSLKNNNKTQNPKQAPGSEQAVGTEPDVELESMNHEIMT